LGKVKGSVRGTFVKKYGSLLMEGFGLIGGMMGFKESFASTNSSKRVRNI
jgi:hypothetical protein